MSDVLGYSRFGAQGTDLGALVSSELGRFYPHQVIGIHLPVVAPSLASDVSPLSEEERAFFAELGRWSSGEGGFAQIQRTKPQTLAYGLSDSPAGLAAWIVEKFRVWSNCDGKVERCFSKEELLTNIKPLLVHTNNPFLDAPLSGASARVT